MSLTRDDVYKVTHYSKMHSDVNLAHKIGHGRVNFKVPAAGLAIGTYKTGFQLPVGAIIRRSWYVVRTAPDSAGHTATIAIMAQNAGDIKAALVVSNAGWTTLATPKAGIQDNAIGNFLVLTAATPALQEVSFVVAVQALTVGEIDLFLDYSFAG